jgi:hypothetical protein
VAAVGGASALGGALRGAAVGVVVMGGAMNLGTVSQIQGSVGQRLQCAADCFRVQRKSVILC